MPMTRGYPRAPVVRWERAHRRTVLLALVILLLLATSPLLAHHLPVGLEGYLAGRDHLWALCLVALHTILAPVHGLLHLLFFIGLAYGLWDRYRAWNIHRRALASLAAAQPQPGDSFWQAAMAADVDPQRLLVADGLANPAFTAGWLQPRIFLARELAAHLSRAELTAVVAHEGAHLSRRDPLRLALLRFLSCTLFWLPALRDLAEDVADETEIRADDRAASSHPLALASAILKVAAWTPRPAPTPAGVGFDQPDLLERRVRRLAGEEIPPRSRVTRRSVLGAGVPLSLVLLSGGVMAHQLPGHDEHSAVHCEQHGAAAVFHLFCLGFSAPSRLDDCPHRADL